MSFDFLHIIDNIFILTDHLQNFALEKAATHSNLIGVLGIGVAFNVTPVQPKDAAMGMVKEKASDALLETKPSTVIGIIINH